MGLTILFTLLTMIVVVYMWVLTSVALPPNPYQQIKWEVVAILVICVRLHMHSCLLHLLIGLFCAVVYTDEAS